MHRCTSKARCLPPVINCIHFGSNSIGPYSKCSCMALVATSCIGNTSPKPYPQELSVVLGSKTCTAGNWVVSCRITFETKEYMGVCRRKYPDFYAAQPFYPQASVQFEVEASQTKQHFHIPLTWNPYGYSTYRGSWLLSMPASQTGNCCNFKIEKSLSLDPQHFCISFLLTNGLQIWMLYFGGRPSLHM